MRIVVKENYECLSRDVADMIARAISEKPDIVLGLATGSTPLGCYRELIRMHREEGLDFSKVTIFNLDEYLKLPPDHPQSYSYFMRENLLNHINFNQENFHIPEGMPENVEEFCRKYEEKIKKAGGIDLQILGIGSDGHIGFNEPGTSFDFRTHLTELAESTIKDNSRFFERESEVPRYAITMGVQTILEARRILLLASGENKALVCKKFIEGPITPETPASILQKHKNTVVFLDKKAANMVLRKFL